MIHVTKSGSVYEVDVPGKRVRRLHGEQDPTPRQGKDGEWRAYAAMYWVTGRCLVFDWAGDGKCTMTSAVMKSFENDYKT